MKTLTLLIALGLMISLSACSTTPLSSNKVPLVLPKVSNFKALPVKFKVIVHQDEPYFALTPKNYNNLSINMNNILKSTKQQKAKINALEKYIQTE